jgi:sec-independent protein translocase protein TatA
MLGLHAGELIVIGIILLVVFSASRMGQLGNAVGRFVYSFRKAAKGEDMVEVKPLPRGPRSSEPSEAEYTEEGRQDPRR